MFTNSSQCFFVPKSFNSAFQLNVSERYSTLDLYDGWHAEPFGTLQHMPIRESSDYYTLGDVLANGRNLHGEHINLLTLVKKVGLHYYGPYTSFLSLT